MSGPQEPVANGHAPETTKPDITSAAGLTATEEPNPAQTPNKRPPRRKGPNYAQIHSKPLPLDIHPLPAFHPTHPISLLRFAYAFISQLLSPPSSHPEHLYIGYFSPDSRSIHITDPVHIRALWEMGFFGKGTLSRSEPSWLDREQAKLKAGGRSRGTAEEATRKRREERRLFKLERARLEAEKIEHQRAVEEGRAVPEPESAEEPKESSEGANPTNEEPSADSAQDTVEATARIAELRAATRGRVPDAEIVSSRSPNAPVPGNKGPDLTTTDIAPNDTMEDLPTVITNEEHLQLTLEEAFFLSFGLGVLDIQPTAGSNFNPANLNLRSKKALLSLFAAHATFPPTHFQPSLPAPDNAFFLSYVAYHHFRSLGWVVRAGTKFGVDFLLYNRGPVFSHAEFAVMIMPTYSHAFWSTEEGNALRRIKEQKDWWWLHCVNRVQSQVKKSLVLCYVEVPPPVSEDTDVAEMLGRYKVREFVIRRWLMNRSRG